VRRESSTVVTLVGAGTTGPEAEPLLAAIDQAANITVVRPPAGQPDAVEAATVALRQAARRSSPFSLVTADPLAAVAARWRDMWEVGSPGGAAAFEEQAARALSAWRARQFELADFYIVLTAPPDRSASTVLGVLDGPAGRSASTEPRAPAARRSASVGPGARTPARSAGSAGADGGEPRPDFYLGPLRAARPHRVVVVPPGTERAGQVRDALRSLPHGPWWPPLDELLDAIRGFYAGRLAEAAGPLPAP
jgi:hypothetical protein